MAILLNLVKSVDPTAFKIALVRLSETSDHLLGQVNNPLAVIRRTRQHKSIYNHVLCFNI